MTRGMRTSIECLGAAVALVLAGCGGSGSSSSSSTTSIDPPAAPEPPGDQPGTPFASHLEQSRVRSGAVRFRELFVIGDKLFGAPFNELDGVGALALPDATPLPGRFSRVPPGGGRFTGPNAQSCEGCHNKPFGTSAGEASANVAQDPARAGTPPFNLRNTTSLFGVGMIQRLAEEMTEDLAAIRDAASASATPGGAPASLALETKGVSFGTIVASRSGGGALTIDTSGVEGVDPDLVVRPFGWKGNVPNLREFVRGASRNELGMEADELVEKDSLGRADPDGDGVTGELTVGDITALTVYVAAQETPTTMDRMAEKGRLAPTGEAFGARARRGSQLFGSIGCEACHIRELRLLDDVFEEPTSRGGDHYRDHDIDAGATSLDAGRPFRLHLAREGDFPRPEPHPAGGVRVALFGDLKRHNMGAQLADAQATPSSDSNGDALEIGGSGILIGVQQFLTPELWGVGSTGPWLHDGRAGSLESAILLHGVDSPPAGGDPARSEAQEARDSFAALPAEDREAVVTFLRSLILFEAPEAEEEE
jgi:hypothetical protein